MEEVSMQFFSWLTSQPIFTAQMQSKLFPVVAGPKVNGAFATYRVVRKEGLSKDSKTYDITLFLWFGQNEYKSCVQFTDQIDPLIENSQLYDWISSTVEYNEELQVYVGIINFNKN